MTIIVDNVILDIYQKDISIHFENFRFSESLKDDYSTDISIPRTKKNDTVLGAYGLLDRSAQIFGTKIDCVYMIAESSRKGYLCVTELTDNTITATLYSASVPVSTYGKKLREIVQDGSASIFPWNEATESGADFTDYGFPYYDKGVGDVPNDAQIHPCVRLNSLMAACGDAIGETMPTVDDSYVIVSANKKVCPQNSKQYLHTLDSVIMKGGQHVCNDYIIGDEEKTTIVFNRACNVVIKCNFGWTHPPVSFQQCGIRIRKSGNVILTGMVADDEQTASITSGQIHFVAGDTMTFEKRGLATTSAIAELTITGYEITDNDYDTELVYIPEVPSMTINNVPWVWENTSYCYFGTLCNLPSVTLRELLSSTGWYLKKKVVRTEGAISLVDTSEKEIKARISTISPISDKLGKKTIARFKDGSDVVKTYTSDFLEDEVVVHESVFTPLVHGVDAGRVELYRYEISDGATVCNYKWEGEGLVLGVQEQSGTREQLAIPSAMTLYDVDTIRNVVEISGSTYEDISDADYVIIDGHKYMVVEGDRDVETGLTTFKALEI